MLKSLSVDDRCVAVCYSEWGYSTTAACVDPLQPVAVWVVVMCYSDWGFTWQHKSYRWWSVSRLCQTRNTRQVLDLHVFMLLVLLHAPLCVHITARFCFTVSINILSCMNILFVFVIKLCSKVSDMMLFVWKSNHMMHILVTLQPSHVSTEALIANDCAVFSAVAVCLAFNLCQCCWNVW